nr:unnamed protein product [Callosobruchus analis]
MYCKIGNLLFSWPKHLSMMSLSFVKSTLKATSSRVSGFLYGVIN